MFEMYYTNYNHELLSNRLKIDSLQNNNATMFACMVPTLKVWVF